MSYSLDGLQQQRQSCAAACCLLHSGIAAGFNPMLLLALDWGITCRPVLLLGALRQERSSGSVAVMALVEAAASVICQPGVQTTDSIVLSSMLQVLQLHKN